MLKVIYNDLNIKKIVLNMMLWSWTLILVYPALYGLFLIIASFLIFEYQNKLMDGCFFLLFCGLPMIVSFISFKNMLKHRETIKKIYIMDNILFINTKEGILGKIEHNSINLDDIENINIELETRRGIRYSTRYCLKLNIKMKDNKDLYNINSLYDNGFEAFISLINNTKYLPKLNYMIKNENNNIYLNELTRDINNFEQNGIPIKLRIPIAINILALLLQLAMVVSALYIVYLEIKFICV